MFREEIVKLVEGKSQNAFADKSPLTGYQDFWIPNPVATPTSVVTVVNNAVHVLGVGDRQINFQSNSPNKPFQFVVTGSAQYGVRTTVGTDDFLLVGASDPPQLLAVGETLDDLLLI